jgi:hypothetical protein
MPLQQARGLVVGVLGGSAVVNATEDRGAFGSALAEEVAVALGSAAAGSAGAAERPGALGSAALVDESAGAAVAGVDAVREGGCGSSPHPSPATIPAAAAAINGRSESSCMLER